MMGYKPVSQLPLLLILKWCPWVILLHLVSMHQFKECKSLFLEFDVKACGIVDERSLWMSFGLEIIIIVINIFHSRMLRRWLSLWQIIWRTTKGLTLTIQGCIWVT